MSTEFRDQDQNQQHQQVEPLVIAVTAKVTLTHNTGTAVSVESTADALRIIRRRAQDDMPLVVLDDAHSGDRLFQPYAWLIGGEDGGIHTITRQVSREADYRLGYRDFTITDPNTQTVRAVRSIESLPVIATRIAAAAEQPVQLTSDLLGFAQPVFGPDEEQWEQYNDPEEPEPLLAGLSDDLFDDATEDQDDLDLPERQVSPAASATTPAEPAPAPDIPPLEINLADLTTEIRRPANEEPDDETGPEAWVHDQDLADGLPSLEEPEDFDDSDTAAGVASALPRHKAPSKELVLQESKTRRAMRATQQRSGPLPLLLVFAAIAVIGIAGLVTVLIWPSADSAPAEAEDPAFVTQMPEVMPADESLTTDYGQELWSLPAAEAQEVSWFGAGVVYVDPDDEDLVLVDHLSGNEIGTAELDGPIQYASEFIDSQGEPAVAVRTEESFIAITADGETQAWPVEETDSIGVSGSTPMLTDDDGEVFALVVGEDDPVEVSGNPDMLSPAIDAETLIQVAAGTPTVVMNSITDDADHDPAQITLNSPAPAAEFVAHLSVGHGLALAEWSADGETYTVVHDLHSDGEITTVLPAGEESTGWQIGRGMDLAIIGDFAIDLHTGQLDSYSANGEMVSALGPAAVRESGEGRRFILEGQEYHETSRIIGYTGSGTALVRDPDGSVTALGLNQGEGAIS